MSAPGAGLVALLLLALLACVKPLGTYIAHVFAGEAIWPLRLGAALEARLYRLCGIDPAAETNWRSYAAALLTFIAAGAVEVYALQRCQVWLPLNPQRFPNVAPDSAFNTAVAFVTNTNW